MIQKINGKKVWVAVISHKRPHNVASILELIGDATFYVNVGEIPAYKKAGAERVCAPGLNICTARNAAILDATRQGLPCVQVSDDLRRIDEVYMEAGKVRRANYTFKDAVEKIISKLREHKLFYGGVAINDNALNYTGNDWSYDKLIVNDLIVIMPAKKPLLFDPDMALKEDYEMCVRQLIEVGGVVRANYILCNFPHRENKGGANTYRNSKTEAEATKRLMKKCGAFIMPHRKREGQVSLNYKNIKAAREALLNEAAKRTGKAATKKGS